MGKSTPHTLPKKAPTTPNSKKKPISKKKNNSVQRVLDFNELRMSPESSASKSQISGDDQIIKGKLGYDPDRPARIYCDGVFDMYHIGHARVLEQAKKLFPYVYLICGVSGDKDTIEKKGKIVMNQKERGDIIKHCKWVDEVMCPAPWSYGLDFLEANNIDFVAHDDAPYAAIQKGAGEAPVNDDIYAPFKKVGKFMATQRTDGISTSDIILRIIQDYDMYVVRQIARGYKAGQIGISRTKLMRIKIRNKFKEFIDDFEKEHLVEGTKFGPTYQKIRTKLYRFMGRLDLDKKRRAFVEAFGDKYHSASGSPPAIMRPEEEEPMSDFDF